MLMYTVSVLSHLMEPKTMAGNLIQTAGRHHNQTLFYKAELALLVIEFLSSHDTAVSEMGIQ